jgi:hypothetical protein
MTPLHDERHDEIVRDIVLGERGASELPDCETCRRDVAELRSLSTRLDDAGRTRREVVGEADRVATPPGADRVGETIRALRGASAAPRPVRRMRPWGTIAVAAALLLAVVIALRREPRREAPDVTLGGAVECVTPVGEGASYDEFRWTAALPGGGRFDLEIRDERATADAPPVVRRSLADTTWRPTISERDALPPTIRWTVTVRDALGAPVARGSARASRSR